MDVGATFPEPMMHGVLGHYLDSGKSPDAWSMATRGNWVGSKKRGTLEVLGEGCQDHLFDVYLLAQS